LLEEALNTPEQIIVAAHDWRTPRRAAAEVTSVVGNANFALLISTIIAIWTLARQRKLSRIEVADDDRDLADERGVIILITAREEVPSAPMLKTAEIGPKRSRSAFTILPDGEVRAGLSLPRLRRRESDQIAQGSSTVAMITAASHARLHCRRTPGLLPFNAAYLGMAIASGSLDRLVDERQRLLDLSPRWEG
jgi:gluconate:H+ symporter, GntP family